jgi:hypothetical protein
MLSISESMQRSHCCKRKGEIMTDQQRSPMAKKIEMAANVAIIIAALGIIVIS